MKVVIIGSGNVATILGRRILKAEHEIIQVISRNELHAKPLAAELGCDYATDLSKISLLADLYIIAVSDNAIEDIAHSISLSNKIMVHTAGSVSKNILQRTSKNYGVLYPLQSLRKETNINVKIPLLTDANTEETLTFITDFAKTISAEVQFADDYARLQLHIAAIIVNNFTNHLYTLTADFCKQQNVDFGLLLPLIKETADRLEHFRPAEMQTGPAIRRDERTIQTHLELLNGFHELKKIYQLFTESIQSQQSGKSI